MTQSLDGIPVNTTPLFRYKTLKWVGLAASLCLLVGLLI